MKPSRRYPSILDHRKSSAFPISFQQAIRSALWAVERGDAKSLAKHLCAYFSEAEGLSAKSFMEDKEADLRWLGILHRIPTVDELGPKKWDWPELFRRGRSEAPPFQKIVDAITKQPDLGWLYLSDGDGRIREASLRALRRPPSCPFFFAAVVYRLNDWVAQVRSAALGYAERYLHQTSPSTVVNAAQYLLLHTEQFQRWDLAQKQVFSDVLYESEVLREFERFIVNTSTGKMGRLMGVLLRRPGFETALPRLAREAKMPFVRGLALQSLILKRVRWFSHIGWIWTDKQHGIGRNESIYRSRSFEHAHNIDDLLAQGASDSSAQVRKMVADTLLDRLSQASALEDEIAQRLASDKHASVRTRALAFLEKRKLEKK